MASSSLGSSTPAADPSLRLDSWKQIAAYLGKSERTVRRWQQTEGLPVHRHLHQQRGSVWAYSVELDQWLERRKLSPEAPREEALQANQKKSVFIGIGAAAAVGAVTVLLLRTAAPVPAARLVTVPLTALPGAEYGPAFSPDGRQVAFFWGETGGQLGIYVKTLGSETQVPLVTSSDGAFNYSPAWSPDGKTIAYLRRMAGETWLHLIPSSGGPNRRLARLTMPGLLLANHQHLCWTADGQWIMAPVLEGLGRHGIFRISTVTGEMRPVTDPSRNVDLAPALAPQGRTLAFIREESGVRDSLQEVMLLPVALDGSPAGNPQSIYRGRFLSAGMAWAPGGKDLVFCNADSPGSPSTSLWRLPARPGASPSALGVTDCATAAVSRPDASGAAMLAFGKSADPPSNLWRSSLSALGNSVPVVQSSRIDIEPSFSPNGRAFSFLSNRSGSLQIWVANLDGSGLRRLTDDVNIRSFPAWSPDGSRIAYSRDHQLFVVPVNGGAPLRLGTGGQDAASPSWSHDGQHLYYSSDRRTWRIRLDNGGRQPIAGPWGGYVVESPDGKTLLYTHYGKPYALYRVPVEGGAEEIVQDDLTTAAFAVSNKYVYWMRSDLKLYRAPLSGGPGRSLGWLRESANAPPHRVQFGMAVAPDDSSIVYAVSGRREIDLLLVRNFR